MSKAGKLRAREIRKAQKRAKKESKRRFWESLISAGLNRKRKKIEEKKLQGDHPIGPCGNIGCKKCNPKEYNLRTPRKLREQIS